jgi:hypothetical protein
MLRQTWLVEPHVPIPPSIEWVDGRVRLVDQRRLPESLEFIEATSVEQLCQAIETLAIRGAPALGAAGAIEGTPIPGPVAMRVVAVVG